MSTYDEELDHFLNAVDNATSGQEGIIAGELISSFSTILTDDTMEA